MATDAAPDPGFDPGDGMPPPEKETAPVRDAVRAAAVGVRGELSVLRDAVLSGVRSWDLAGALDAAAQVEDVARLVRHLQLVAAGAVAEAYARPETETPGAAGLGGDAGPLTFGAAAHLHVVASSTEPTDLSGSTGLTGLTGSASGSASTRQSAGAGSDGGAPDGAASGGAASSANGAGAESGRRGGRRPAYRNAPDALRVRLRVSGAEARGRVAAARDVLARVTLAGQELPAEHPLVGELVADGAADADAVGHILRGLRRVRRTVRTIAGTVGAEQVQAMERIVCDAARDVDADDVRRLVDRCVHLIDQDGPPPTEADLSTLQGVFFSGRRDGLHQIKIITDDIGRELLETIFATGTNPRVNPDICTPPTATASGVRSADDRTDSHHDGPDSHEGRPGGAPTGNDHNDGERPAAAAEDASPQGAGTGGASETEPASTASGTPGASGARDGRSVARRRLDALLAACSAALRAGALPATGGLPTQIMVTVGLEELRTGLGSAFLPYTGPVPARTVRRLACDAGIIPMVLGTTGRVLDVGRSRRLFTHQTRQALVARDGGCAFPGCQMPAPWCEGHHIAAWWNDGVTSVDNGVLVCSYHHHLIHDGHWRVAMANGIPRFHPPWDEPTTTHGPQRNHYHRPHPPNPRP